MSQENPSVGYYDRNASAFVRGTVGASMGEALDAFSAMLPERAHVLDWGCGSGRDSLELRKRGFEVTSVDASPAIAEEALAATQTIVRVETFDKLDEIESYDGIWACASLLHVRPEELPAVLARAHAALRPEGVLYCSFKYGVDAGVRNGRWFTNLNEDALSELLQPLFHIDRIWTSADVRPGRGDERWLNCLATKR